MIMSNQAPTEGASPLPQELLDLVISHLIREFEGTKDRKELIENLKNCCLATSRLVYVRQKEIFRVVTLQSRPVTINGRIFQPQTDLVTVARFNDLVKDQPKFAGYVQNLTYRISRDWNLDTAIGFCPVLLRNVKEFSLVISDAEGEDGNRNAGESRKARKFMRKGGGYAKAALCVLNGPNIRRIALHNVTGLDGVLNVFERKLESLELSGEARGTLRLNQFSVTAKPPLITSLKMSGLHTLKKVEDLISKPEYEPQFLSMMARLERLSIPHQTSPTLRASQGLFFVQRAVFRHLHLSSENDRFRAWSEDPFQYLHEDSLSTLKTLSCYAQHKLRVKSRLYDPYNGLFDDTATLKKLTALEEINVTVRLRGYTLLYQGLLYPLPWATLEAAIARRGGAACTIPSLEGVKVSILAEDRGTGNLLDEVQTMVVDHRFNWLNQLKNNRKLDFVVNATSFRWHREVEGLEDGSMDSPL